jgi:hypothetical protein
VPRLLYFALHDKRGKTPDKNGPAVAAQKTRNPGAALLISKRINIYKNHIIVLHVVKLVLSL